MTPGPEIEPGTHWWEASALTTAPPQLPKNDPDPIGCVWTGKFDLNTYVWTKKFFDSGNKKLRFQKIFVWKRP